MQAEAARAGEEYEPIADDDWEMQEDGDEEEDGEYQAPAIVSEPPRVNPLHGHLHAESQSGIQQTHFPLPQRILDKNHSDPFRQEFEPANPFPPREAVHPDQGVYMVYVLAAWLHSQFHLPFRACNAMLVVFGLIIHAFGITLSAPILTTLPSVLTKLGVEPTFRVLPVCPHCLEVYSDKKTTAPKCTVCGTDIFKTGPTQSGRARTEGNRVPKLRFPIKSLASQLAEIISLPGMEDELERWRKASRKSGEYNDFFDGAISKELKGHDNEPFFRNGVFDREDGPDGELRIGVTLGADWSVH